MSFTRRVYDCALAELTPPLSAEDHVDGPERAELDSSAHAARVQRDVDNGLASGVNGTPSFFVGGRLHAGSFDAASLIAALEASSS